MRRRLIMPLTIAAFAVAVPAVAGAKPKPRAKATKPTVRLALRSSAVAGTPLRLAVHARAAKGSRLKRYTLRFGDGTRARRGRRPGRAVRHTYRSSGRFVVRLTVVDDRGRSATASLALRIRAVRRAGPTPGRPPAAPAAPAGPPAAPPGTPPASPGPLDLDAAAAEVVTGSAITLPLPDPVAEVTRIDAVRGLPGDVTVDAQNGAVSIAARSGAVRQSAAITIVGSACTSQQCGHPLTLRVPLDVRGLAAPDVELESFTAASPDRRAAAVPIAGVAGAATLRDELVIALGTPDDPGTREDADDVAGSVGATVSGGIAEAGVFELRWTTPQDLELRRQQLLAIAGVADVSDTTFGLIRTNAQPPGDWDDDGAQVTWPFERTQTPQAWDLAHGSSVKVGILDGDQVFGSHEDLDVVAKVGSDGPGLHATHVAGTACARANGKGVVGFAWGCPIVTAGNGDGTDKALLENLKKLADQGAKVVNISMGYGTCTESDADQQRYLALARNYYTPFRNWLRGAGKDVVVTASAGNNCNSGVASPWGLSSDLGNVITVAAINSDRTLAYFSSFGDGVEVAAPGGRHIESGAAIWSTLFERCGLGLFRCDSYGNRNWELDLPFEGTSMAAPAVAGIVALVRERHPSYGASRAAGCVVGHAGTGGVGSATTRSTVGIPTRSDGTKMTLAAPFSGSIPVVNARAAVECRSVQFDGSPGTGAPPATLGGHPMTSFGVDAHSSDTVVSSVADAAGTVLFSPSLLHLRVGDGWATWSHGYAGSVYFSGEASGGDDPAVELTLPAGTRAFSFYAEPNTFASFSVEAIAADGTSSEPVDIEGDSGARYFGFYGAPGQTLASISVTASDPRGFAVGEFAISR